MLQAVSVLLLLLLTEPVKSVFTAIVLRIYFHKTYLLFFPIYTSFSGSKFTFLAGLHLMTPDDWDLNRCAVCLHLSKSGVNWILSYVPDSGYKCKVACIELYIPLLRGPALPHCSIRARDDGSESRRKIINNSPGTSCIQDNSAVN